MLKIKVCFISGAFPKCHDGIGDYVFKLIQNLDRQKFDLALITSNDQQICQYIKQQNFFLAFPVIKNWNIFALLEILRLIKKENFQIIHFQFPSSKYKKTLSFCFFPFFIRLFYSRVKIFLTLHEFSISYPINRLRQILLTLACHQIIVTDANECRELKKFIGNSKTIEIIPIGSNIDIKTHQPRDKEIFLKSLGETPEIKIISFFGFIHGNKGLECLLESISKIVSRGFKLHLLLIAQLDLKNPYHNKITSLIDFLGIKDITSVTGYLPEAEVSKYLSFSDILVFPFQDGVSLRRTTFLASLEHSKAIISTKAKTYPSCLVDGENICLIPINDQKAMAETIQLLLVDNDLRQKIAAGAGKASKAFSWQSIAKSHEKLYQKGCYI